MIRLINDGDRNGYLAIDGKKSGAIKVNGVLQAIGNCKYIELDDNNKVVSLRKELPKKAPAKKTKKKEEEK